MKILDAEHRQLARQAVSQAKIARLNSLLPLCEWCHHWYEPADPPQAKQRFCSNACRNASGRARRWS